MPYTVVEMGQREERYGLIENSQGKTDDCNIGLQHRVVKSKMSTIWDDKEEMRVRGCWLLSSDSKRKERECAKRY